MGGGRVSAANVVTEDPKLRPQYEAVFGELLELSDRRRFPPSARPAESPVSSAALPGTPAAAWKTMAAEDQLAVNRVFANIGKALAAYQRTIVTRDSPFDQYVRWLRDRDESGKDAISPAAQRGLQLFVGRANCRSCHSGPNFTDGEFHAVRVPPLGGGPPTDAGRYLGIQLLKADFFNAASEFSDDKSESARRRLETVRESPDLWGLYKTPTLRNVALTAPYMHQGQFATLRDVMRHYSKFENALPLGHHARELTLQPLNLSEAEMNELIAFLESLSDSTALSRTGRAAE